MKVEVDFVDLVKLAFHRELEKNGITITVKPQLLPEVLIDPAESIASVSFSLAKSESTAREFSTVTRWKN